MAIPELSASNGALSLGAPVSSPLAVQRVNAQPAASFIYSFPPESLQLLDVPKGVVDGYDCPGGKFWLPQQVRLVNASGVNGVRVLGDGESPGEVWRYTLQLQAEKGAVIIPPDLPIPSEALPAGAQPGGYLREAPVVWRGQPGTRYITPWDLCTPLPGGAPAKWTFDREKYALWLWWLVASGRVPAVHPAFVDAKKGEAVARVVEVEGRAALLPEGMRGAKVEEAKAAARVAQEAPAAAKVTRKGAK